MMDTAELVALYLTAKADIGLAEATLAEYRRLLGLLTQDHPTLPLDPELLQAFIKRHGGQAPDSLKSAFRKIHTFYRWLVKRKCLDVAMDPFIQMESPKGKAVIPRVLSIEQVRRVVESSDPPYNRALILTLVDTAARVGELVGRTKDHLSGGTLELYGKTGGRLVPVSPEVYGYLMDLPTYHLFPVLPWSNRGEVIDRPAGVSALQGRARRIMKRSGLRGRKLGPHTFRHSAATTYVNQGGDLKSLSLILGHTSTRMAERYVTLAMDVVRQKHATYGMLQAIRGGKVAVVQDELPSVELPAPAREFPLAVDRMVVVLFLVVDRRKYHVFYYIRAREDSISGRDGGRKWPVCSLGTDLPLNEVDAYRQAILRENQRRRNQVAGQQLGDTLIDVAELAQYALAHPEDARELIDQDVVTDRDIEVWRMVTEAAAEQHFGEAITAVANREEWAAAVRRQKREHPGLFVAASVWAWQQRQD